MERLQAGDHADEIMERLPPDALPPGEVTRFVMQCRSKYKEFARTDDGRGELRRLARRKMLFGLAWIAGGIAVTVSTYLAAKPGVWPFIDGDHYVLAWPAVLYGMGLFAYGVVRWFQLKIGENT
jgi:hypothetical protein